MRVCKKCERELQENESDTCPACRDVAIGPEVEH